MKHRCQQSRTPLRAALHSKDALQLRLPRQTCQRYYECRYLRTSLRTPCIKAGLINCPRS
eukprot:13857027-Alexandrium_andersonii.AAC.1